MCIDVCTLRPGVSCPPLSTMGTLFGGHQRLYFVDHYYYHYVCVYIYLCICMYICIHIYIFVCLQACTYKYCGYHACLQIYIVCAG